MDFYFWNIELHLVLPGDLLLLQLLLDIPGDVVHPPEDIEGEKTLEDGPEHAKSVVSDLGTLHTHADPVLLNHVETVHVVDTIARVTNLSSGELLG